MTPMHIHIMYLHDKKMMRYFYCSSNPHGCHFVVMSGGG